MISDNHQSYLYSTVNIKCRLPHPSEQLLGIVFGKNTLSSSFKMINEQHYNLSYEFLLENLHKYLFLAQF